MRIFQIDDGYSEDLGTWLKTNEQFPSGLRVLAKRVLDAGFIPGIWNAPFIAKKSISTLKENPDWILRNKKGKKVVAMWNPNWGVFNYAYCLDVSHPGIKEHLHKIFPTCMIQGIVFSSLIFYSRPVSPANTTIKIKLLQVIREAVKYYS